MFIFICTIFDLITSQISRDYQVLDGTFDKVIINQRFLANVLFSKRVADPIACIIECLLVKECQSINFHDELKVCELLNDSLSYNESIGVEQNEGWTHYDYSKVKGSQKLAFINL